MKKLSLIWTLLMNSANNKEDLDSKYQNVILELSDGRLIRTTVPAFCQRGDDISICDIQISDPKELPEGCFFEDIES